MGDPRPATVDADQVSARPVRTGSWDPAQIRILDQQPQGYCDPVTGVCVYPEAPLPDGDAGPQDLSDVVAEE